MDTVSKLPGWCAETYGDETALIFKDRKFSFLGIETLKHIIIYGDEAPSSGKDGLFLMAV